MWRAARALISCCYATLGGASSPDETSHNLNNINGLKFYHSIRGNLEISGAECADGNMHGLVAAYRSVSVTGPSSMLGFRCSVLGYGDLFVKRIIIDTDPGVDDAM